MLLAARVLDGRTGQSFFQERADFRLIIFRVAFQARTVERCRLDGHDLAMAVEYFSEAGRQSNFLNDSVPLREP